MLDTEVAPTANYKPPNRRPAHHDVIYWGYEDIGLFFLGLLLLGPLLRLTIRAHILTPGMLLRPTVTLQTGVMVFLLALLYSILKLRYRRHVWAALGWTVPACKCLLACLLSGGILALTVDVLAHTVSVPKSLIRLSDIALLAGTLAPVLEESLFRGFLLPVLARTMGSTVAVLATALVFTALHQPATAVQWVSFMVTGTAYGWIRVNSGSTAAAGLMHGTYNLTLILCQKL